MQNTALPGPFMVWEDGDGGWGLITPISVIIAISGEQKWNQNEEEGDNEGIFDDSASRFEYHLEKLPRYFADVFCHSCESGWLGGWGWVRILRVCGIYGVVLGVSRASSVLLV